MTSKVLPYLFVLMTAVLLNACKVSEPYHRPEMAMPEKFRTAGDDLTILSPTDSAGIGDVAWEQFFTDTTLQSLIDSVLHRNYDIRIAYNTMRENHAFLKQAKSAGLPEIQAYVSANTNRPSENSLNGLNLETVVGTSHIEDYTAAVGVSWEIDAWGKISSQKEAALSAYLQSEAAVKWLQTGLIASTAYAYYQLLMLREQLDIARRNVSLNDSTLRIIRLQQQAGDVTILATQQAEVQKKSTEVLIPQLEQAIQIQENALRILMAHTPAPVASVSGLDRFSVPAQFSAGVPAALLSRRPDVKASEYALQAANAKMGIAQANRYPALQITADGGLNAFKASNWFLMPASLFGNLAGNLVQPLLSQRRLKTAYEVAKIQRESAVIRFKSDVLNAVSEVSDALVQLDKIKTQLEITQAQKKILESAIPNARLLFNSGMASYLEVITAQQNALQNELALADLKRQQIDAYILLYRSLGGGV